MKALTLTQPWASAVALGLKRIETRSWMTQYRGRIAIHAAKGISDEVYELCARDPLYSFLVAHKLDDIERLPRGVVVATCRLIDVDRIDESFRKPLTDQELMLGDYRGGRYGWTLREVKSVDPPIPARGVLGLWEWDTPAGVLL